MKQIWLSVGLALLSCREVRKAPPAEKPTELSVLITSELRGYLGPCGCSQSMRGGIDRLAQQVSDARAGGRSVVVLDSGNALFGAPSIADEAVAQQERKARAVAQALALMKVDAVALGPLDLARGAPFLAGLGLPAFPSDAVVTFKQVGAIRSTSADTLEARARDARASGHAFIVGLFEGPFDDAVKLALREGLELDLVVATRGRDELALEESRLVMTKVPVVQVQNKGRTLLKVDLFLRDVSRVTWLKSPTETQRELDGLGQRIELLRAQVNDPSLAPELATLKRAKLDEVIGRREALAAEKVPVPETGNAASVRLVPLETTFPTLPEATALVTAYDRDVGTLNLDWAKRFGKACEAPPQDAASYVGTAACASCHQEADAVYRTTKHSSAYAALVEKGKNHHLDCVGCHVTGWKQPGGTCRIDQVDGKTDVGCESCHGPGGLHVAAPSKATIVRSNTAVCTSCHDRENSPHFDLEKYLPAILGPGHGAR